MAFTVDYTSPYAATWLRCLAPFVGAENVRAVEIGALEGRTSLWLLTHVLTHPTSRLVCIDPGVAHGFAENVAPVAARLTLVPRPSQDALRDPTLIPEPLDVAYVDGDHAALSVLQDAVACFAAMRAGGVLILDDYLWTAPDSDHPVHSPRLAIDAFLVVYEGTYRLLHKEWQVIVQKL